MTDRLIFSSRCSVLFAAAILVIGFSDVSLAQTDSAKRPNIILVMTDDQGFGDVGFHGNTELSTPHLDRLASESAEFTNFYVQPLCTPTRAALLTGRYPERTGAVEVNYGRSIIREEEITIAENLKAAGYRTGIFGKWHLGDNFPVRPSDKGFEECSITPQAASVRRGPARKHLLRPHSSPQQRAEKIQRLLQRHFFPGGDGLR